jgi:hypothetical protein
MQLPTFNPCRKRIFHPRYADRVQMAIEHQTLSPASTAENSHRVESARPHFLELNLKSCGLQEVRHVAGNRPFALPPWHEFRVDGLYLDEFRQYAGDLHFVNHVKVSVNGSGVDNSFAGPSESQV